MSDEKNRISIYGADKNTSTETAIPRISDEIIITVHSDGWAIDHSERVPSRYLSFEKLLKYKYHLVLSSEVVGKINHKIRSVSDNQEMLKDTYEIQYEDIPYRYEITFIPTSYTRTLLYFRRIIEERELRDIKANYQALFRQNAFGIVVLDSEYNVLDINNKGCDLLDRPLKHLKNKSIIELLHPDSNKKLQRYLKLSYQDKLNSSGLELRFIKKNDDFNWLHFSLIPVSDDKTGHDHYIGTFFDINDFKKIEEEKKREKLRVNIEDGNIYWIDEKSLNLCYSVFDDYLSFNYHRLILSRTPEDNLKSFITGDFEYLRLGKNNIYDDTKDVLSSFRDIILKLPKKSVVLFDDIDYLFTNYDFNLVLVIIQFLRDVALLKNLVILIPVNRKNFTEKGWSILEKEGKELKLLDEKNLSDDLIETLKHIFDWNRQGYKPTYKDICRKMNITYQTCRNRIQILKQNKLVEVIINGREKNLIVTKPGEKNIQ
jgi:PAS domain S-box-containing protein